MRIERAELAVYDARAVDLLKRWHEHRVPCGDVDAIAGPQPDSMAAVLGDKAEAIPLGLEDPPLIVEGGVDECREHRSISGIHAFLFQSESEDLGVGPWSQPHHKPAPPPPPPPAIRTTSGPEFSTQATAGIPSAMIRRRRQPCHESTCTPAVKVPSARRVKTASPVACAVKILCTLLSSIKFMTSRKANQCSACVTIRRNRPFLSPASCHPAATQTSAMIGARISQYATIGSFEKLV